MEVVNQIYRATTRSIHLVISIMIAWLHWFAVLSTVVLLIVSTYRPAVADWQIGRCLDALEATSAIYRDTCR